MFWNLIIIVIGLLLISFRVDAQEWGEISEEELAMTRIDEDPDAEAVILFDRASIVVSGFSVDYERHKRIKILKENGKRQADVSIYFPEWYDLNELEAKCYSANGDEFELQEDKIFDEYQDNVKRKVFAIPGVEIGSVIEYKYSILSHSILFLETWFFQSDIFTKLSELTVYIPQEFKYNAFRENTTKYNIEKIVTAALHPYYHKTKVSKFTFKGENLPAIKPEPFMTNIKDYAAQINFQLISTSGYFGTNYMIKSSGFGLGFTGENTFIKTWDDLAKIVKENNEKILEQDYGVEEVINSLKIDSLNTVEKTKILYDFVRDKIETQTNNTFDPPETVLQNQKGDPYEKNLLLLNLLRNAKIEAYPVLISTRDNGKFYSYLIQIQQFNHTLICASLENKYFYLDTSEKYCPFGMLPVNSNIGKGLIIKNESGNIIDIPISNFTNLINIKSIAQINEEGQLYIKSNIRYEGILAIEERVALSKSNEKEYVKEKIKNHFNNAKIDTFNISDITDVEKPLNVFVKFRIEKYAQITEDLIYCNLPLFEKFEKNPFTSDQRSFPVDYPFLKKSIQKIDLYYPSSYQVSEVPSKGRANFSKLSYSSFFIKTPHKVEVNRIFKRNNYTVHHSEYQKLKVFYDKALNFDQAIIVFEKKK